MASVPENLTLFNDPATWSQSGDSWKFHAEYCGQPYDEWKQSLATSLLLPYLGSDIDVVEIGPGQGRWSEFIVDNCRSVTLVDLSPYCVDACRARFGDAPHVSCVVNDGHSLPVPDRSADLVWSFGTFVHIDAPEIDRYLSDVQRVLRPGGRFVVHHAGWVDWTRHLLPWTQRLGRPGRIVQRRLAQNRWRDGGGRSAMSAEWFAAMATDHSLAVERQIRAWGDRGQYSVERYRDVVTVGSRA